MSYEINGLYSEE